VKCLAGGCAVGNVTNLKGQNILIFNHPERKYTAKISDFGCAVITSSLQHLAPGSKIRLPGCSPPWNAPEATRPIDVYQVHQPDVFSLGLVMWRILAHCDPFAVFDLPLDKTARLTDIQSILSIPQISGLIPLFIQERSGVLDANEVVFLVILFSYMVRTDPEKRDLYRVVQLLGEDLRR
jgi:hypothetical protein